MGAFIDAVEHLLRNRFDWLLLLCSIVLVPDGFDIDGVVAQPASSNCGYSSVGECFLLPVGVDADEK